MTEFGSANSVDGKNNTMMCSNKPHPGTVRLTHKPTGMVQQVNAGPSATKNLALANKVMRGRVACPQPTARVRTYDLTPGMMSIRGGGIETRDPAEIEAIMYRDGIPDSRWAKKGAK
jgi:hypothetical protein